ncbi:YceI family protein [Mycobacterium sp.]|uniref:YceI family protein n=1 Tax=Mycobacterium sp. TaxID=1785 RepID=UPI003BA8E749
MNALEELLADPAAAGSWHLVPERSTVSFSIKNMWGLLTVTGRFTEFTGDGQLNHTGEVSGRINLRVASLSTGIRRRDKHLLSPDFFDADRFGQITVVVAAVTPTGGATAQVRADFSIKGITAPVTLPATITRLDDGSVRVSVQAEVNRSQFGLGWNALGMVSATAAATADAVFVPAPRHAE